MNQKSQNPLIFCGRKKKQINLAKARGPRVAVIHDLNTLRRVKPIGRQPGHWRLSAMCWQMPQGDVGGRKMGRNRRLGRFAPPISLTEKVGVYVGIIRRFPIKGGNTIPNTRSGLAIDGSNSTILFKKCSSPKMGKMTPFLTGAYFSNGLVKNRQLVFLFTPFFFLNRVWGVGRWDNHGYFTQFLEGNFSERCFFASFWLDLSWQLFQQLWKYKN